MKPTLLILAAGMGSRYGGLKQMDAFGPNGETIIDYSIYDAINAGFGMISFIIREEFREAFEAAFIPKLEGQIEYEFIAQDLHDLPKGFELPAGRVKPWGTAHAVWAARKHISTPFGIINADDYYGKEAYEQLVDFLRDPDNIRNNNYCIIAYYLKNTLSDHGTVNRGIVYQKNHSLDTIVETLKIKKDGDKIYYPKDGHQIELHPDTLVSMNMFGFMPTYFNYTTKKFMDFLNERINEEKSEYYIPNVIDDMNRESFADIKVIESDSNWFGVTYQDDKPFVQKRIIALIEEGVYPEQLWDI
jgi:UTP-glucose-1-phosphate uridylyltransferase